MKTTLSFLFLSALLLGSCREQGCTEFGAENYDPDAVINDGSCVQSRDKFIGRFSVSSECAADDYIIEIDPVTDPRKVEVIGLADSLPNLQALIFETSITIDEQPIATNVTVEGAGLYDTTANGISFTFRITDLRSGNEVVTDCVEWFSKLED